MKILIEIDIDEDAVVKKEQRDQDKNIKTIDDVDMDFIAQLFVDLIEGDEDVTQEFTKEVDYSLLLREGK